MEMSDNVHNYRCELMAGHVLPSLECLLGYLSARGGVYEPGAGLWVL